MKKQLDYLNKQDVDLILRKSTDADVFNDVKELVSSLPDDRKAKTDLLLFARWLDAADVNNKNEKAIDYLIEFSKGKNSRFEVAMRNKDFISEFFSKFDDKHSQFLIMAGEENNELQISVAMNGNKDVIVEAFVRAFFNVQNFRELLMSVLHKIEKETDNNNNNKNQKNE